MKITVVGSGYVGMSLSVLLAQQNEVTVLDIDPDKVDSINSNKSTVVDFDISSFLAEKNLKLRATLNKKEAYKEPDFIIVATPTNFNPENNSFDTSSVDSVVKDALEQNKNALNIIKSTIPIGHTKSLQEKYQTKSIIFSPEFLREGKALFDNLYPSRIILGSKSKLSRDFANILSNAANKENIDILFMESCDAEAIKLFANSYLAMRVSFFNELDSFALSNKLDAKDIIEGICLDERIGLGYNNPSFGYGGYCLPKDTKQLLSNFNEIPQNLIEAIVTSNKTRKFFLASEILKSNPKVIGFYRLTMKEGSDNFRSSAIQGIIEIIKQTDTKILIYEPFINDDQFLGIQLSKDLEEFKRSSNIIVANRLSEEICDISDKVFSRDIFGDN